MGSSIKSYNKSGIYSCSCGNLETHVAEKSKAPCSSCDKNDSWTLIIETEELEKCLKYPYSYENEFRNLQKTLKERYDSK